MTREPPTAGSELEIVEEVSSYKRLVEDLDSVFEKLGAVGMRSPSKPLGIIQRDLDKEFDVSNNLGLISNHMIHFFRCYCAKFGRSTWRFRMHTFRCVEPHASFLCHYECSIF